MQFDLLHCPLGLGLEIALTNWSGSAGAASHWRVDSQGKDGGVRLLLGRGDDADLAGFSRFLVPGTAKELTPWVTRWLGQAKMSEPHHPHPDASQRASHRVYNVTSKGTHEDALAHPQVLVAIEPVWEYLGK